MLRYSNPMQLLVAVMLSAQCTDKKVNEVTEDIFKKYITAQDFARAHIKTFEKEIYQTGFYHTKARHVIGACRMIVEKYGGKVPKTMEAMTSLPGVGRKTANVVLSNAYSIHEGIAVDTHVKRIAYKLGLTKETDPEKIERDLCALIPKRYWNIITYLFIEYGRGYCPARHKNCTCELYMIR